MGRGLGFSDPEDKFIVQHAESKTADELFALHESLRGQTLWPKRSVKSLARRVERLRELGKLGLRTEETRRKAYYDRDIATKES